jgi:ribosomal-protein-alanine N-acetyltransferase
VLSRRDGAFLGTTMLFRFERDGTAEIGFWLGPAARGRGLGAATIALTLRWGFEQLGLSRIEGLTATSNAACRAAMARAGMRHEGDGPDGFVLYASDDD